MQIQFLAVIVLTISFSAAQAADYYISAEGNDNNSGAEASPFRSIPKGLQVARAGDTVFVKNGTYSEAIVFQYSGEAGKPITLTNYPNHKPLIRFKDPNGADYPRVLLQSKDGYQKPIGWIVIQGFEITNGYDGIKLYNAHDIIIRKNNIHQNAGQGILGNGLRVTIDQNIIARNGGFEKCLTTPSACNKDHGIYATGSNFTITNNIFQGNLAYGIQMAGYPYDPTKYSAPEYAGAQFWLIANNVFAYQNWRDGIVVWQAAAVDSRIENNIFFENSQLLGSTNSQGISFYDCGSRHSVKNNLFYASGQGGMIAISDTGHSYSEAGNKFQTNPLFKDPINFDFHLLPGSPAIDVGVNQQSVFNNDFEGNRRPQGSSFDLGAFEFSKKTLSAPKNLKIY